MHTWMKTAAVVAGVLASGSAAATVPLPVPEPGVFELLAAGAIAGAIVWARNRRK